MYTAADYDYNRSDPYYGLSEGVACALPDLRYTFALALGVVVVAAALVIAVMQRLKHSG